jgi:tetratricopeptide (TPR) repeat protein
MRSLFVLLVVSLLAVPLRSQEVTGEGDSLRASDSVFVRARRLVAEGHADSGRALVQAALDAAPVGSPQYVEALYWRAVVAATAADAERDLRRIVIEYPLSARSADALLRLAQLEMTRGESDQALQHLQRIVLEHPESPERARAELWMARVLFDRNDAPRACARLADALRITPVSAVELRNQIEYLEQRCVGADTTMAAGSPQGRAPAGGAGGAGAAESGGGGGKGKIGVSTAAQKTGEPFPTSSRAAGSRPARQYTVQVAAYSTLRAAERLRASLVARGYDARVVGTEKPFRVRVGRYDTRAAADSVARQMRVKKITAYVTEAEPPR